MLKLFKTDVVSCYKINNPQIVLKNIEEIEIKFDDFFEESDYSFLKEKQYTYIKINKGAKKNVTSFLKELIRIENRKFAMDVFDSLFERLSQFRRIFAQDINGPDKPNNYHIIADMKFTLDEVDEIFESRPSKLLLFNNLKNIDFENSSKFMILRYMEIGKIEICYLLVGAALIQFSTDELLEIINFNTFYSSHSLALSGEPVAKANKYRLLKYQDNLDEEVVFTVVEGISNSEERESIGRLFNEKHFIEKIESIIDQKSLQLIMNLL